MAGFRKAGVFPFNPDAVSISTSSSMTEPQSSEDTETSPLVSSTNQAMETTSTNGTPEAAGGDPHSPETAASMLTTVVSDGQTHAAEASGTDPGCVAGPSFSQAQERRFQVQYEEGFDVSGDMDYICWLRLNHPDSPLVTAKQTTCPTEEQTSRTTAEKKGRPTAEKTDHPTAEQTDSPTAEKTDRPTAEQTRHPTGESVVENFSEVSPLAEIPLASTQSQTTKMTPSTSAISKLLIPPQVSTPSGRKEEPPRARLLTSAAAFEMLKEKERKKQEEAEMKEKKRKEREEVKKRKEEEQRKKAEERARKQEQRAKEKAQKEAQRAKKGKEKQTATVGTKRGPSTRFTRPSKSPRMEISSSNDNKCCVCFVAYDDDQSGKDWVACACGRWLHEDCADDCVLDSDGNECLCFVCLNRL